MSRSAVTYRCLRPASNVALAEPLSTTPAGTNSAHEITRVLNKHVGKGRHKTTEIPAGKVSAKRVETMRADIVDAICSGDAVVVNIVGTARDKAGQTHTFGSRHYIAVVGYSDNRRWMYRHRRSSARCRTM